VHVARRGEAGADVQELGDARFRGQVGDGAADEGAVLPRGDAQARPRLERLFRYLAVGGEIVLAAKEVVVDPRGVRLACVDLRGSVVLVR
jgi:hypothetical protein